MDSRNLKNAIALSTRLKNVYIATAGANSIPHIAAAGPLTMRGDLVGVSAWYCPQTLANVGNGRQIAIAVWDKEADSGYQLTGRCEKVEEVAVMDGYSPKTETKATYPQVERMLLVRVEKIFAFTQALHTDTDQ
jgi:hypothetical protein